MKHFIKSTFLSFIVTTFVFSPQVMAKPSGPKVTEKRIKDVLNTVQKSKRKGVKVSEFIEATKPLLKRKIFKRLRKDNYPYWDRRMTKVAFGKSQVIVKYKNHVIAAKYVDKGPVAFIVNNKPLLWKDVVVYERMKKRMYEIMGIKGNKKVSFLNDFMRKLSSEAFADDGYNYPGSDKETKCKNQNRKYYNGNCAGCVEGTVYTDHPNGEQHLIENDRAGTIRCKELRRPIVTPIVVPAEPAPAPKPAPPVDDEEGFDKRGLILFGIGALAILMLWKNKRKKSSSGSSPNIVPDPVTPVVDDTTPAVVWTPEGSCPTPGARGLTPADLPPECRGNESCVETNTCTTNEGSLDGTPEPIGFLDL